ncbi:MAG TPA: UvrB/UvrC motif-containing protein [Isosphaeraceae bacterium]|nr:UvrB/UvrC motif-containing protein [Isosphaeraceae bacterium]
MHLTETVDGHRRELHLCLPCARKAGVVVAESEPQLALDAVLQSLIVKNVGELVGTLAELACPVCGLKFMQFRADGRLGCPHDYEVFHRGLVPVLQRVHEATRHVGKQPGRRRSGTARLQLRAELREAVAREDYEQAAKLRDRLRQKDAEA